MTMPVKFHSRSCDVLGGMEKITIMVCTCDWIQGMGWDTDPAEDALDESTNGVQSQKGRTQNIISNNHNNAKSGSNQTEEN